MGDFLVKDERRVFSFEEDLRVVPIVLFEEQGGGHMDPVSLRKGFELGRQLLGSFCTIFLFFMARGEANLLTERGVFELGSVFDFLGIKSLVIVLLGELKGGMFGVVGLNHDFAGFVGAARPSRHLSEQLKGVFRGAEVGSVEPDVGHDHADQGKVGEVQAFADHLGADEDVHFSVF